MKSSNKFRVPLCSFIILLGISTFASGQIGPGDHIAIVGNTFADQLRNNGYLETLLLQEFEEDPISLRNLGWAGDTLTVRDRPTNFPTEESTLRDHETDVIIACFGMSESFAGDKGLENFKKDLLSFIDSHRGKQYNDESDVRLILVSPIAYENLGTLTPNWQSRNRDLNQYAEAMMNVAMEETIPYVDLFTPTSKLFDDNEDSQYTINGIHLNSFGYWAVSNLIYEQLMRMDSKRPEPWRLHIDAKTGAVSANGVELSRFNLAGQNFSFEVKENSHPSLPPPVERGMPGMLSGYRDTLVIENLEPGEYSLMVDGKPVATATHEEWAAGVPIDTSPAHEEVEDYRSAVIDKNTQFIYSWKALNQVHIVGERRNSSSGRALPQEIIEFNELTKQKDGALRNQPERKTREWQLVPDTKLTN
ncbi:MAG: SGNH/GDSL hydrolase family protein [Verrucomicrobia bacterium]|nr:SGNH/GDSL hydrolase family protein [Verrucomicrobiota bacterium]MDA1066196.1 SGNH/GDSL hydrolase family protein [Verrucomicrobiota bacterium]